MSSRPPPRQPLAALKISISTCTTSPGGSCLTQKHLQLLFVLQSAAHFFKCSSSFRKSAELCRDIFPPTRYGPSLWLSFSHLTSWKLFVACMPVSELADFSILAVSIVLADTVDCSGRKEEELVCTGRSVTWCKVEEKRMTAGCTSLDIQNRFC
jgi:hypothetical protein